MSVEASGHRSIKVRRLLRCLAIGLRFFLRYAPLVSLQAASRHRPIARDRRGSLLGPSSINNAAFLTVRYRKASFREEKIKDQKRKEPSWPH